MCPRVWMTSNQSMFLTVLFAFPNRSADRFLNARFRRTDDFKYFVDVIFHFILAAGVSEKNRPAERAVEHSSGAVKYSFSRRDYTHSAVVATSTSRTKNRLLSLPGLWRSHTAVAGDLLIGRAGR